MISSLEKRSLQSGDKMSSCLYRATNFHNFVICAANVVVQWKQMVQKGTQSQTTLFASKFFLYLPRYDAVLSIWPACNFRLLLWLKKCCSIMEVFTLTCILSFFYQHLARDLESQLATEIFASPVRLLLLQPLDARWSSHRICWDHLISCSCGDGLNRIKKQGLLEKKKTLSKVK